MITLGEIVLIHDLKRQGLSRLGHRPQARAGPQDRAPAPRGRHRVAGLRPARGAASLIAPYEDYLRARIAAWPELSGKRLLRESASAAMRAATASDRLSARRPAAKGAGLRAPLRDRRRQAGAGRLRPVPGGVHRRARRRAHPVAVHDGARPQPLALGPVLRDAGSADRPALPHRRLRRHGRRAVRAALRPHEDGGDRRGRQGRGPVQRLARRAAQPLRRRAARLPAVSAPRRRARSSGPTATSAQDFWLARSFRNLDDLNAQFDDWRTQIANPRVHATTRRVVDEHFAEERPALIAHPAIPYSAVLTVERRISREGMVSVGGNLYSVPDTTRKRVARGAEPSPARCASSRTAR